MCLLHSTLVFLYSCTTISVQSNLSRHYTLLVSVLLMEKSDNIKPALHTMQLKKNQDGIYVPDGIIPMHQSGGLIQEGADNIDINTETVDGKNTFHSMARAVFQIRHYAVDPNISQSEKKRSQERYVQISNSASSLTACLVFSKPKTRGVRGRIENALTG